MKTPEEIPTKIGMKNELILLSKFFGLVIIATLFFGLLNNFKIVSKSATQDILIVSESMTK